MNLRKKYKWAIDLIRSCCGDKAKVLTQMFDYDRGLRVAIEQGERAVGIILQRPELRGKGKNMRCVGLYQISDTEKTRQHIKNWVGKFLKD